MSIRIDHVSIVVEDLPAAVAFFQELGMEVEGQAPIQGEWVDRVCGLTGVNCDIVMLNASDGHGRLELTKFHAPQALTPVPDNSVANTLGLRSLMFEVDDVEEMVDRLTAIGGALVGEAVQYEQIYRLCYLRGPAGVIVALAEKLQ